MPLTSTEKIELEMAFDAVRQLAVFDAAKSVVLEWKRGEHPTVNFLPTVPLEYVSVEFTIKKDDNA